MKTLTVEAAQAGFRELIEQMRPGEDVVITKDEKPVARLTATTVQKESPRQLGSLKGTVLYMAPDFDAPLEDFKEYMR